MLAVPGERHLFFAFFFIFFLRCAEGDREQVEQGVYFELLMCTILT